ncbi:MAG: hypothetical protein HDS41_01090 [Bacteroides sp.]|nr:hypothetical protein [Bacteroides sp.]
MVKLDRICSWLFIINFALFVPSSHLVGFTDELTSLILMVLIGIDCILNRNWLRYKLLWIIVAIMTAYAIYSLTMVKFNTIRYVVTDWIIQLKPYIAFVAMLIIAPSFNNKDKYILRNVAIFNVSVAVIVLFSRFFIGKFLLEPIFFHVMTAGMCIYISAAVYMFCSINKDGTIERKSLIVLTLMLITGLMCTRSKYYGEFVIAMFFMYLYRPGIMKHVNFKNVILIVLLLLLIFAVSWKKIEYYFITGNSDSFDPNVMETYARPVLYFTSFLILCDYFPFGSGLASFATFASVENYSGLYYEYGLNYIWGLSPSMPDFICDAFYPSLAQFGFVGILLFIYFWVYIYKYIKVLIRVNPQKYKNLFCIGVMLMCFVFIESIASTTFVQFYGMMDMMFLGIICAKGYNIKEQLEEEKIIGDGKI